MMHLKNLQNDKRLTKLKSKKIWGRTFRKFNDHLVVVIKESLLQLQKLVKVHDLQHQNLNNRFNQIFIQFLQNQRINQASPQKGILKINRNRKL